MVFLRLLAEVKQVTAWMLRCLLGPPKKKKRRAMISRRSLEHATRHTVLPLNQTAASGLKQKISNGPLLTRGRLYFFRNSEAQKLRSQGASLPHGSSGCDFEALLARAQSKLVRQTGVAVKIEMPGTWAQSVCTFHWDQALQPARQLDS